MSHPSPHFYGVPAVPVTLGLRERLRDDPVWRESPAELFAFVRDLLRDAQNRWGKRGEETLRTELLEPLFKRLGLNPAVNRPSKSDQTQPDYLLKGGDGKSLTAAFVYSWDRWLDGPDLNDADTPEENPGACVVTALDAGTADWIIVTNGRLRVPGSLQRSSKLMADESGRRGPSEEKLGN